MKPDFSELRDIHLPEPVSWWPPAPGWWLAMVVTAAVVALVWSVYRWHRQSRWRRGALAALAQASASSPDVLPGHISILLRRIAISRFPRHEVAGLTGEDWLAFLDRTLDDGQAFRSGAGRVLTYGPYRRPEAPMDSSELIALCERWIRQLPARRAT